ncbi:betaine-aldehyde dehydrogenase [Dialister invisus]|uniref:betaine-aldehyde dehydrogenase n=1 Tax=Dialister invisus TaxID=218538 RepID=UPI003FD6C7C4
MKRNYIVNGKVSYPQNDGVLTTFSFHNPQTGDMMTIQTTSQEETDELNYGDTVTLEIRKSEPETVEAPEEEVEKNEVAE